MPLLSRTAKQDNRCCEQLAIHRITDIQLYWLRTISSFYLPFSYREILATLRRGFYNELGNKPVDSVVTNVNLVLLSVASITLHVACTLPTPINDSNSAKRRAAKLDMRAPVARDAQY